MNRILLLALLTIPQYYCPNVTIIRQTRGEKLNVAGNVKVSRLRCHLTNQLFLTVAPEATSR
jgi:hypothetical protein